MSQNDFKKDILSSVRPPLLAAIGPLELDRDPPCAPVVALFAGASSASARMVSNVDSTPATACEMKEPHLEVFVGIGGLAI